jgi:hypothetical protein
MRRMARLQARLPQVTLVHTPIHASWFNQIEIYCFSIVQRKVLTRNDFRSLIPVRIASSTSSPPTRTPPHHFRGTFTRRDLHRLRAQAHVPAPAPGRVNDDPLTSP